MGTATHGNLFLAAFSAGIAVATFRQRQRASFEHFRELIAEIYKLAALLVFGALITPAPLGAVGRQGRLFAILALVVARPVAIWLSFLRSGLTMREQAAGRSPSTRKALPSAQSSHRFPASTKRSISMIGNSRPAGSR
ncbi:hypothetical protein ABGB17_09430 [Sphaerisporangium sp. B11E5]|uniref:hypothetical protein n=1 Tax=Sphaerisporangium sp. B11E5 TaxID=3153563 RepID=UPI00325F1B98